MEVLLIILGALGFIALTCWLVSIGSKPNVVAPSKDVDKKRSIEDLVSQVNAKLGGDFDAIMVNGVELSSVDCCLYNSRVTARIDGVRYFWERLTVGAVDEGKPTLNKLVSLLEEALVSGEVVQSRDSLIRIKLRPTMDESDVWMHVESTPFYISWGYYINMDTGEIGGSYNLDTLSNKIIGDMILENNVVICEDPNKTHWKLFLKWEMEAKKKQEDECLTWVNALLIKQQEYNDLRYQYAMIPSVPIVDFTTLKVFCGLVSEEVKYNEYLVSNVLLSKGLKVH